MKADLEDFGQSLDPATSPRLRKAVTDTIALLGGTTETIDVLIQKLYGGQLDPEHLKRPPVLYFPYQRQFIVSNESGFPFHNYARGIWNRAKQLVSNASEIRVTGYSFSGIDRGPMLDMLDQALSCRRLVIQSPDSDEISNRLKLERSNLRNIIESVPITF
jgi:hypothetical protein